MQGDSNVDIHENQKQGFDLGVFVGDLALDEDASRFYLTYSLFYACCGGHDSYHVRLYELEHMILKSFDKG